jgi:hypothetical protein
MPAAVRGQVQASQPLAVATLDAQLASWRTIRQRACAAPAGTRAAQLSCLDGVIARLAALGEATAALERGERIERVELGQWIIDPAVCEGAKPPRLTTSLSPELTRVLVAFVRQASDPRPVSAQALSALADEVKRDPCAEAKARSAAALGQTRDEMERELATAERAAEQCGDDRISADVALAIANAETMRSNLGPISQEKLDRAATLVARVAQPVLEAQLAVYQMRAAERAERADDAIADARRAIDLYAKAELVRQRIETAMKWLSDVEMTKPDADIARVLSTLATWRAEAVARFGEHDSTVETIDQTVAGWQWTQGDPAAYQRIVALTHPVPPDKPQRITGRVVDQRGAPVAGAAVHAAPGMFGVSESAAFPSEALRTAVTGADGTFVIPDAAEGSLVIAELGDRRSSAVEAAASVQLTLAPTSRIEGRVELNGLPAWRLKVAVRDRKQSGTLGYGTVAPVHADGTFTLAGVPRGRVGIVTVLASKSQQQINGVDLDIRTPVVRDVKLATVANARTVHVIIRSAVAAAVPNAQVLAVPGKVSSVDVTALNASLKQINVTLAHKLDPAHVPAAVAAKAQPGDLYAELAGVPATTTSICAIGLPEHMDDPVLVEKLRDPKYLSKIPAPCVADVHDDVVVVVVPPWPRFD